MGGRSLKAIGVDAVRVTTPTHAAAAASVIDALHAIVPDLAATKVRHVDDKATHGDLDILVDARLRDFMTDEALVARLSDMLGHDLPFRRPDPADPVLGMALPTPEGPLQVDLISSDREHFGFCDGYLAYGECGTLIGRMARRMGMKLGMRGTTLPVRHDGTHIGRIVVTLDFDAMLRFLDLDPAGHKAGFADEAAMHRYIGASKWFDPAIYEYERLTADAKRRAKERPGYERFLAAARSMPARYDWFADSGAESWIDAIEAAFPGTIAARDRLIATHRAGRLQRRFFSGATITAMTGIGDPVLRHLMNAVRSEFATPALFAEWSAREDEDDLRRRLDRLLANPTPDMARYMECPA